MSKSDGASKSGTPLSFYEFSDSSRDAIFDTLAFLTSQPVNECDLNNLHRIAMQAVEKDHDPSETLLRARVLCRFGCLVGSIAFICQELESMLEDLEMQAKLPDSEDAVSLQLTLVRDSLESNHRCFGYLQQKNMARAYTEFQETRAALMNLRKVMPAEASIEVQRILHTTALASQMLDYAAGK